MKDTVTAFCSFTPPRGCARSTFSGGAFTVPGPPFGAAGGGNGSFSCSPTRLGGFGPDLNLNTPSDSRSTSPPAPPKGSTARRARSRGVLEDGSRGPHSRHAVTAKITTSSRAHPPEIPVLHNLVIVSSSLESHPPA